MKQLGGKRPTKNVQPSTAAGKFRTDMFARLEEPNTFTTQYNCKIKQTLLHFLWQSDQNETDLW